MEVKIEELLAQAERQQEDAKKVQVKHGMMTRTQEIRQVYEPYTYVSVEIGMSVPERRG